jgi:phosphoglycolate phosphatase-like HAD superfamily hydrolase
VDNRRPIKLLPQVAPTAAETAAAANVQPPQPIKLQGILYSATRPAAILNGRTVFVGDRIGDMTIASISQKQVTLLYGTNNIVVKLP